MGGQAMSTIKVCSGCGINVQSTDSKKPGFAPESAFAKPKLICQRCFRIKHYNEVSSVSLQDDDFLRILNSLGAQKGLVVKIVDLFDLEGSWISGIARFFAHHPILIVVNKIDLFPKSTTWPKIKQRLERWIKANGIQPTDIVLCSASKGIGMDDVAEAIDKLRRGQDVFVVGSANVGKSTLINRLIRDYSDMEMELTTSRFPGTTLDLVHIPLDDGSSIIDTPGLIQKNRVTDVIAAGHLSQIMPDKLIRPIVFQLSEGQTLFFGGLARVDFIKGERQSFVCYFSNALNIHRTKLTNADELYANHQGEMLSPPTKEELESFPKLVRHTFQIKQGVPTDIVIAGLGWISFQEESTAQIEVRAPKGIQVSSRMAIF
jgi:ribosome biogenesis GTPase YqeH